MAKFDRVKYYEELQNELKKYSEYREKYYMDQAKQARKTEINKEALNDLRAFLYPYVKEWVANKMKTAVPMQIYYQSGERNVKKLSLDEATQTYINHLQSDWSIQFVTPERWSAELQLNLHRYIKNKIFNWQLNMKFCAVETKSQAEAIKKKFIACLT